MVDELGVNYRSVLEGYCDVMAGHKAVSPVIFRYHAGRVILIHRYLSVQYRYLHWEVPEYSMAH